MSNVFKNIIAAKSVELALFLAQEALYDLDFPSDDVVRDSQFLNYILEEDDLDEIVYLALIADCQFDEADALESEIARFNIVA